MDVEMPNLGKRARVPTEKGADYAAELAKQKAKSAERKAKLRATLRAKNFPGLGDMLAELDAINTDVPEADGQLDALADKFAKMGGRRRRTHKKMRKSRKTRRR